MRKEAQTLLDWETDADAIIQALREKNYDEALRMAIRLWKKILDAQVIQGRF